MVVELGEAGSAVDVDLAVPLIHHVMLAGFGGGLDRTAVQTLVKIGDEKGEIAKEAFEVDEMVLIWDEHAVRSVHVVYIVLHGGEFFIAKEAFRWIKICFAGIRIVFVIFPTLCA